MKKTVLILALAIFASASFAQKKTTTSANISFDATTDLDKAPKAENATVIAAIDTKTGTVAFEANVKNFAFSNPNMQNHFNGAMWMDSDKFPTAFLKGNITNLAAINFAKAGIYPAVVEGDLTIHGVTKKVKTTGSITVTANDFTASAEFTIKLEDYGINGPAIGAGKVAKEPNIKVTATLK